MAQSVMQAAGKDSLAEIGDGRDGDPVAPPPPPVPADPNNQPPSRGGDGDSSS